MSSSNEQSQDVRLSFDHVAEVYDRIRPSYPDSAFDAIFATLPANPRIIEVGPGTGQATSALLQRGAVVTAVDVGPNLCRTLNEKLGHGLHLMVINSSIEDADLPRGSFDALTSACAYHLIESSHQTDVPARLLKPGGLVAIIDLTQVRSPVDDGYFDRVQDIYVKHGQAISQPHKQLPTADELIPRIFTVLDQDSRFSDPELVKIQWDQSYSADEYADLLRSYSGMQMMPSRERELLINDLVDVIRNEFNGTITRPLIVAVTTAHLS